MNKRPDPELVDDENPEWTPDMAAKARRGTTAAAVKRARGRPKKEETKVPVTIRLSPRVVDHFRDSGRGWQTRIDEILSRHVKREERKA